MIQTPDIADFYSPHLTFFSSIEVEMYEKDRIHPWPYNKGFKRNAEEIFGRVKWRWLLPIHSKEDVERMMGPLSGKDSPQAPLRSSANV